MIDLTPKLGLHPPSPVRKSWRRSFGAIAMSCAVGFLCSVMAIEGRADGDQPYAPTSELWKTFNRQREYLARYHSPGTVERMAPILDALDRVDQGHPAIQQTRDEYTRANLYVFVGADLLTRQLNRRQESVRPIRENILGTTVTGTGWTTSDVTVHMLPSIQGVRLRFQVDAHTRSQTVGVNGAATARTIGETWGRATKDIAVTGDGVFGLPTQTVGETRTRIVGFEWNRLLGRQIAYNQALARKPASEAESNRRAQIRLRNEVDRKIEQQLSGLQRRLGELRAQLRGHGVQRQEFRSTSTGVELAAAVASPKQLTTRQMYPVPEVDPHTAKLVFHESLLNNLLESKFAGRTIDESAWQAEFGNLPAFSRSLKPQDPDRMWTVRFEQLRPIVIRFGQDRLKIGLRATSFQLGDRSYPPARIAVSYRPLANGVEWQRDGRLEIDVLPGEDSTVGVRQQIYRSLLRKRFENVFPGQLSAANWTHAMSGNEQLAGSMISRMIPVSLRTNPGWVTISMSEAVRVGDARLSSGTDIQVVGNVSTLTP